MYSAVIVAGGSGLRTGLNERKIWYSIHGKAIIEHTVKAFESDKDCAQIVIVGHHDDLNRLRTQFKDRATVVPGGATRSDSVQAGLDLAVAPVVFIHDAARPCVSQQALKRLKEGLKQYEALSLAVPIVDALKTTQGAQLTQSVSRENLVAIQTPQAFQRDKLQHAYRHWVEIGKPNFACDASLYETMLSEPVYYVLGARTNIKFTTLDDVALLEAVLS